MAQDLKVRYSDKELEEFRTLIEEKIEKAKAILCSPKDKSITQIAYQLGYSDSSYFSKQFKRVTGFTPRQYERSRGSS